MANHRQPTARYLATVAGEYELLWRELTRELAKPNVIQRITEDEARELSELARKTREIGTHLAILAQTIEVRTIATGAPVS